MPIDKIARRTPAGLAALSACVAISAMPTAALADEQYFGIPSNRVGPYAAMGTGYYGGIIDYLNYVNLKGGVNGVKLTWTECETEYNAARTVECYQRLLHNGDKKLVVFDTLGTPGAYAVINRMAPDQVVLAQYGYGRTDAADGAVWPWVFNAAGQYWAQSTAHLNFIAQKEGGIEKMKGKTLVHLHIDTAYGREPLPAMREVAKQWGFKLVEIAVPPPGLEQQSQWLQIRREKADWVTFWGAGSGMNSTAITTAARIGFPRDKMLYVTFGGAEEDMIPAGDAAKGTFVAANAAPGKWPLIQDIEKVGLRRRQGQHAEPAAHRHRLLQPRRRRGGDVGRGTEERAEDPRQGGQGQSTAPSSATATRRSTSRRRSSRSSASTACWRRSRCPAPSTTVPSIGG